MSLKDIYEQHGCTCDQCRWKVERDDCPWDFDYEGTDYAEDCVDFRYINDPSDAFEKGDWYEPGEFRRCEK